ncbi:hypothetical protein DFH05DRAFT_1461635 [Lentinula detonsa]|uniref:Uncharacterized protein n=1 Tax=Lentinula detonsa TaxID=2804962 RepID=A0A9W8TWC4_9AGAR|nr:hypothetical protein DFH05DRAFT_1461635 [Lentinula detonsa]
MTHDEDLSAVMKEDEMEVPSTSEFIRRLSNYLILSEDAVKEIDLQVSMESWKDVQDRHVISNLNDMSVDTRHSPYQNKAAILALNNLEISRATLHREHLFLVFCENVCTLVYTVLKICDEVLDGKLESQLDSDWQTLCSSLMARRTVNNSKKYLNKLKNTLELIIYIAPNPFTKEGISNKHLPGSFDFSMAHVEKPLEHKI